MTNSCYEFGAEVTEKMEAEFRAALEEFDRFRQDGNDSARRNYYQSK